MKLRKASKALLDLDDPDEFSSCGDSCDESSDYDSGSGLDVIDELEHEGEDEPKAVGNPSESHDTVTLSNVQDAHENVDEQVSVGTDYSEASMSDDEATEVEVIEYNPYSLLADANESSSDGEGVEDSYEPSGQMEGATSMRRRRGWRSRARRRRRGTRGQGSSLAVDGSAGAAGPSWSGAPMSAPADLGPAPLLERYPDQPDQAGSSRSADQPCAEPDWAQPGPAPGPRASSSSAVSLPAGNSVNIASWMQWNPAFRPHSDAGSPGEAAAPVPEPGTSGSTGVGWWEEREVARHLESRLWGAMHQYLDHGLQSEAARASASMQEQLARMAALLSGEPLDASLRRRASNGSSGAGPLTHGQSDADAAAAPQSPTQMAAVPGAPEAARAAHSPSGLGGHPAQGPTWAGHQGASGDPAALPGLSFSSPLLPASSSLHTPPSSAPQPPPSSSPHPLPHGHEGFHQVLRSRHPLGPVLLPPSLPGNATLASHQRAGQPSCSHHPSTPPGPPVCSTACCPCAEPEPEAQPAQSECWVCYGSGPLAGSLLSGSSEELLSPCRVCSGGMRYIHRGCFHRWLESSWSLACPNCKGLYDRVVLDTFHGSGSAVAKLAANLPPGHDPRQPFPAPAMLYFSVGSIVEFSMLCGGLNATEVLRRMRLAVDDMAQRGGVHTDDGRLMRLPSTEVTGVVLEIDGGRDQYWEDDFDEEFDEEYEDEDEEDGGYDVYDPAARQLDAHSGPPASSSYAAQPPAAFREHSFRNLQHILAAHRPALGAAPWPPGNLPVPTAALRALWGDAADPPTSHDHHVMLDVPAAAGEANAAPWAALHVHVGERQQHTREQQALLEARRRQRSELLQQQRSQQSHGGSRGPQQRHQSQAFFGQARRGGGRQR